MYALYIINWTVYTTYKITYYEVLSKYTSYKYKNIAYLSLIYNYIV